MKTFEIGQIVKIKSLDGSLWKVVSRSEHKYALRLLLSYNDSFEFRFAEELQGTCMVRITSFPDHYGIIVEELDDCRIVFKCLNDGCEGAIHERWMRELKECC
ncbi:MAG: hypothetical protein JRN15_21680 [Nitrososphaerota archaeon]|nr:hypothetical protein [Nitrososphaerota archaeon]